MKIVAFYSPVDAHVYDGAGGHVGPRADGTIEYGLPSVGYHLIGHYKFVILPNDSTYRLEFQGTATGVATVNVADYDGATRLRYEQYHDLDVSSASHGILALGGVGTTLRYDQNGTGTSVTVTPSSATTSTASDSTDTTAPTTTTSVQGTGAAGVYLAPAGVYLAPAEVHLRAADDLAGVNTTEYSLDGGTTWTAYTAPIRLATTGTHQVKYRSTDWVGNREAAKTESITIVAVLPAGSARTQDTAAPTFAVAGVQTTAGKRRVQVTVQDAESGLTSVLASDADNAAVDVPAIARGSTGPLVATATKTDQGRSAKFRLTASDAAGNAAQCDVVDLVVGTAGALDPVTVAGLTGRQGRVTIRNGAPGLASLRLTVNGRDFDLARLADGEERSVDISAALLAVSANTVRLTPVGGAGATATILLSEAAGGSTPTPASSTH